MITFKSTAKFILLLNFSLFLNFNLFAQDDFCATVHSPEAINQIKNKLTELHKIEQYFFDNIERLKLTVNEIPIKAHIVRKSDGSGGLTQQQLNTAIDEVNIFYSNANMQFILCNGINYIDDDTYYDFDKSEESTLTNANSVDDVINIYFVDKATFSGNNVCGYAYFPNGPDTIVMVNSCTLNGSTLAHEIGHYFNLLHTHGGSNKELVDGTNCDSEGDLICDTSADPKLTYSTVNNACEYTDNKTDFNGDTYNPPTTNVMSYSRKPCRTEFTADQYARIYATLQVDRNYLECSNLSVTTFKNAVADYKIYRNTNNTITVIGANNSNYKLFNVYGQLITQGSLDKNTFSISNFSNGIYFLSIENNGIVSLKKIVL